MDSVASVDKALKIAADAGTILFGRYLCDDRLSVIEQHALVSHLLARYRTAQQALTDVVSCFMQFIRGESKIVNRLATDLVATVHQSLKPDELERSLFGGSPALRHALGPILRRAIGVDALLRASFGTRRKFV